MDANKLYESAKEAVVKIKAAVPSYSAEEGVEFAVIADGNGKIFSAMTNVTFDEGEVKRIPADVAAFLYMKNSGSMVAESIIVISVADRRIVPPSEECLDLMFRTNSQNDECEVVVSSSEKKPVSELRLGAGDGDFMDGFDFDDTDAPTEATPMEKAPTEPEEEAADTQEATNTEDTSDAEAEQAEEKAPDAPAAETQHSSNVISGIQIDESNPFYEAPADVKPPEEVIAMVTDEQEEEQEAEQESDDNDAPQEPQLTKEELLKQAKKRKKVARANFLFRKRK